MTTATRIPNVALGAFAATLGVSAESLVALGAKRNGRDWVFPERDADGQVIGHVRRTPDGRKIAVEGSHRGLTMPWPMPPNAGASPEEPILVPEGASCTAAGMDMEFVTVGRPSATGGVDHLKALLSDRHVVIVGENDDAGRRGVEKVAEGLVNVAASLRIIFPPEDAKDLRAWVTAPASCDHAEIMSAIQAATEIDIDSGYNAHTDYGNAQRLVRLFGDTMRYCHPLKTWYVWDRRRWRKNDSGRVMQKAKETARRMYAEASRIEDKAMRQTLIEHARRSESASRLSAMIDLAKSEPGIPVAPDELDADPCLLNVRNGTIDLRTGELRKHKRGDLITKLAPVEYDPKATFQTWTDFLADSTDGDKELTAFLQRAVGYSLTGDTGEEVLFFVHGPAAAGKSTFVEAVKAALGGYATTADFETFLARRDMGGPRNDVARLAGARMVASIEVDEGKRLAEGLLKMLTGGDTVAARHLYRESFEFRPAFKLWLCANHAPRVHADDTAMWRRILRLPFEHPRPEEAQDPQMKATLRDPAKAGPAILAWAVRGCLEWQRDGLKVPGKVKEATEAYREDQDPIRDFVDDRCVLHKAEQATSASLRDRYEKWCELNGENPVHARTFGKLLTSRGCKPTRIGKASVRGWSGIGLKAEADTTDTTDTIFSKPPTRGGS